jgi:hypothetical protein
MGIFKKISKLIKKTSNIADPISGALRKQGGALGTVGAIMNPGATAAGKMAGGAPINARTMFDPYGWAIPTPPPPEAPPIPLPPLVPGAPASLPQGLQPRPVPYSYPTTNGPLTNLAYRMAGPPGGQQGAPGLPPAPPMNAQPNPARDVGLFPMPRRVDAQGLPMLDPLDIARLGMYQ